MAKNKHIPYPNVEKADRIVRAKELENDEKIVFSFKLLNRTKYFNLDCTCESWSSDLFEIMKDVSKKTATELYSGYDRTFRFHSLESATLPDDLPNGIMQKDVYQIRLGKSNGGFHGVLVDNVFYVVWFDPLHNAFPNERYGGLKVITPPKTCCDDSKETVEELSQKLFEAEEKIKEYESLLDKETSPDSA